MDQPTDSVPDDSGAAGSDSSSSSKQYLAWPPPGLEAMQGRLWSPIALMAIGDCTLGLPLLWSAASEHEVWSFGPFGGAWWIPLATTAIGLLFLLVGWAKLFGLLRVAAKAGRRGHGWLMVVQVASDFSRDTGFLLQGARLFSDSEPPKRGTMLVARMIEASAYLAAVLWVPFGLVVSVMLGARGVLPAAAVWYATVAPAALLVLVGLLSRLLGRKLAWSARRDRSLLAAVDEQVRDEISAWNSESESIRQEIGLHRRHDGGTRWFGAGSLGVILLAVFVVVPVITVTMTSAVGTVLAAIAMPSFDRAQARVAVSEVLRRYKLDPDGSVSSVEAGEALHSLLAVSVQSHERVLDREPVRSYDQLWFPEDTDSVMGGPPADWALSLFGRSRRQMSRQELDYLATVAGHPAHAEFRTIALADSVDLVGTRYVLPFPDSVTPWVLPIPNFRGIRDGASAHIALAAFDLARGQRDRAEETLREVISVGFVLIDEGSTIIDAMIGTRLVDAGAEALESFYRATSRGGEAENLAWVRTGMEEALERAAVARTALNAEGALRMMPDAVLNETVVRGLRWEYFLTFSTLAPCVNLNKVVFKPGRNYENWLADAEGALVRRPSDEALFRFLEKGWFRAGGAAQAPGLLRAALRLTFGSSLGGTCAAQLGGLDMIDVVQ